MNHIITHIIPVTMPLLTMPLKEHLPKKRAINALKMIPIKNPAKNFFIKNQITNNSNYNTQFT